MRTHSQMAVAVATICLYLPVANAANAATPAKSKERVQGQIPAKNAQTKPEIEELTVFGELSDYSALKSSTPIMEVARSVSVVTEDQIIERGALTVADTYTYSSGVLGDAYGFATRGDWVIVRGFEVPQYQDSLQSLFGYYNAARPDVYTLEQVEILKGPASVLYGKGTPGGIVNLVTKRPREEAHHEINIEGGNYNRQQVALDSTSSITDDSDWLYRLVSVYRDADTQVDYVEDKTLVLAPSVTWRPTEATDVTLLLNHTNTKSDIAEQFTPLVGTLKPAANDKYIDASAYFGDPDFNKYDTSTNQVTLLSETEFSSVWSSQVSARYSDSEAHYNQAWPTFFSGGERYVYNPDSTLYKDGTVPRTFYRSDASSEQAAIDLRLRGNFSTGVLGHETLIGTQYQNVRTDDDGYYEYALGYDFATGGPDAIYGDAYWINLFNPTYGNVPPDSLLNALYTDNPEAKTSDIGLYFNDQITVDNWHILLGLRYDKVDTDTGSTSQRDDATSFSTGVLYRFENGISPYANYAQSFEPVIGTEGDSLKPQEGDQVEVGLKYEVSAFPGVFTLAYFDIEQSNLPNPSALPGDSGQQQQGKAHVDGVEFGSRVNLGDFDIELALTKLKTRDPDGYNFATVPDKQASTWINYRPKALLAGLHTGAGVRYVGSSFDGADNYRTPSYTLVDLLIGYARDNWDATVQLRNATDEKYLATCLARGDCFFGEERTVVGRLSMNF